MAPWVIEAGVRLGPFNLGMGVNEALSVVQKMGSLDAADFSFDPKRLFEVDLSLRLPTLGVQLTFNGLRQDLRSICICLHEGPTVDEDGIQTTVNVPPLAYGYSSKILAGGGLALHALDAFAVVGPTWAGTWQLENVEKGIPAAYLLQYPGLSMEFRLPAGLVNEESQKGTTDHPEVLPGGDPFPSASRIWIHSYSRTARPVFEPASVLQDPVDIVEVRPGVGVALRGRLLRFGGMPQDVFSDFGPPDQVCVKEVDNLRIHSAKSAPMTRFSGQDYYYNYFHLGLDLLFDGRTHQLKKVILHTNPPTHELFTRYRRCFFRIPVVTDGRSRRAQAFLDARRSWGRGRRQHQQQQQQHNQQDEQMDGLDHAAEQSGDNDSGRGTSPELALVGLDETEKPEGSSQDRAEEAEADADADAEAGLRGDDAAAAKKSPDAEGDFAAPREEAKRDAAAAGDEEEAEDGAEGGEIEGDDDDSEGLVQKRKARSDVVDVAMIESGCSDHEEEKNTKKNKKNRKTKKSKNNKEEDEEEQEEEDDEEVVDGDEDDQSSLRRSRSKDDDQESNPASAKSEEQRSQSSRVSAGHKAGSKQHRKQNANAQATEREATTDADADADAERDQDRDPDAAVEAISEPDDEAWASVGRGGKKNKRNKRSLTPQQGLQTAKPATSAQQKSRPRRPGSEREDDEEAGPASALEAEATCEDGNTEEAEAEADSPARAEEVGKAEADENIEGEEVEVGDAAATPCACKTESSTVVEVDHTMSDRRKLSKKERKALKKGRRQQGSPALDVSEEATPNASPALDVAPAPELQEEVDGDEFDLGFRPAKMSAAAKRKAAAAATQASRQAAISGGASSSASVSSELVPRGRRPSLSKATASHNEDLVAGATDAKAEVEADNQECQHEEEEEEGEEEKEGQQEEEPITSLASPAAMRTDAAPSVAAKAPKFNLSEEAPQPRQRTAASSVASATHASSAATSKELLNSSVSMDDARRVCHTLFQALVDEGYTTPPDEVDEDEEELCSSCSEVEELAAEEEKREAAPLETSDIANCKKEKPKTKAQVKHQQQPGRGLGESPLESVEHIDLTWPWADIQDLLSRSVGVSCGRPLIYNQLGHMSFGNTYFHAIPGLAFEVMQNDHLASLTVFSVPPEVMPPALSPQHVAGVSQA